LLYYELIRTILPKSHSTDSVNTKTLALIYLLMTGKPINFAHYILGVIAKLGSIKRPTPLPYTNLLTLMFQYFGVGLTNELKETKPVPVLTPASLKTIQFFKTESGDWKFVDDMTPADLQHVSKHLGPHVKPRLHSPQPPSSPSLLGQVQALEEQLYELQETADRLDYILIQHTDALDGLAHNQVALTNQITAMQSSLVRRSTTLNQKVDDLLRMCSVTQHCALKGVPLSTAEHIQCANLATQSIRAASKASPSTP